MDRVLDIFNIKYLPSEVFDNVTLNNECEKASTSLLFFKDLINYNLIKNDYKLFLTLIENLKDAGAISTYIIQTDKDDYKFRINQFEYINSIATLIYPIEQSLYSIKAANYLGEFDKEYTNEPNIFSSAKEHNVILHSGQYLIIDIIIDPDFLTYYFWESYISHYNTLLF